jgi:crotonobetainyl-CoA:carnitine CoA-transferase CaiB-like acyl-CoA transferase
MSENPEQLFSGVKVLAVARVIAAPFAARHLAVNGADVITIENPEEGDSSRVSEVREEFLKRRMGRGFLTLNVNRRSLTLALNTPEGQDIFRKLARDADVVIENLRSGTMARYGVGYADLKKINPGIIFCSITGFGQTGPKAKDPGIDDAIQAASGMMSFTGTPESGPLKSGSTVVDYTTGYAAAFAIAGALFHRTRTGEGQAIDLSMLETAMSVMSNEVTRAVTNREQPPLHGNGSGVGRYVSNTFRCREGVIMIAARSQNLRGRLWKSIGREDIPKDPRFATDALARQNMKELEGEVQKALLARTAREWEEQFNRDGVPAMRVMSLLEAVDEPQIAARGFIQRFEADPEAGLPAYGIPTVPYRFSDTPAAITKRAPGLGEHTDAILLGLGLSREEIAGLRDRKIV